jgi:hypothetical protein
MMARLYQVQVYHSLGGITIEFSGGKYLLMLDWDLYSAAATIC